MNENKVLEKIISLGVSDPKNPSSKDTKTIMDAYLKNKKLDEAIFKDYMNIVNPTLKALFEGLKEFSRDHKDIEVKTLNIIEKAMDILHDELKRDLSDEERKKIREEIFCLVKEARDEAKESRTFLRSLAAIGGGVVIIFLGTGVYILTKGKNKEMIANGVKMISKAV